MKYTIKLEILPDKEQVKILNGQSKVCNWLYNHLLETANNLKKQFKETRSNQVALVLYSKRGLRDLIPQLKKDYPFLKTVHSKPIKNTALRLSEAIQNYQKSRKGRRKGKPIQWPKFKRWKQNWFSLYYCEPWNGYKIEDGRLILSLGKDKDNKQLRLSISVKQPDALKSKTVKTLEVVKEYNKFYACFTINVADKPKKPIHEIISIDPSHKNIGQGVDNNGISIGIKNINRLIKRHQSTTDYLKSRRDLCEKKSVRVNLGNGRFYWKPSNRWIHFDNALQRAYKKKRDQINHLLYALANQLYHTYDLVMIGDYTPQPGTGISRGMRRAMNNESVIGGLKRVLSHVANKSGKHFMEYPEYNTTKKCNACGYINADLTIEDRVWICPVCNTYHLRDENSAINGLKDNYLMSCSDPFEVTQRCTWEWNFSKWMQIPMKLIDRSGSLSANLPHRFAEV